MNLLERTKKVTLMPEGFTLEEAICFDDGTDRAVEFIDVADYPTTTITERTILGKLADKLAALTGKGNA